jgi:hypothetical protein
MRKFNKRKVFMAKLVYLLILVGLSFGQLTSCSDTSFTGASSGEKKDQPTDIDKLGEDGKNGESLGSGQGDDLNKGVPGGELIDNGDGTVSEQFFGLASLQTSVVVDVIIAMDTSGSMNDEKKMMEQSLDKFLKSFSETPGVDHQVFMIGSNFSFPKFDPARFSQINQFVNSNDALLRIQDFMNGKYKSSLQLRAEAVKEFLIVTDDNSSLPASSFVNFLDSRVAEHGAFRVNALAWLPGQNNNGQSWCTKAKDGHAYVELGKHPNYGGLVQHLCEQDWSKLLSNFAEKVIKVNAKHEFILTKKADPNDKMIVTINKDEKQKDQHWTFNNEKNSVVFVNGHSPQTGDNLVVTYVVLE